MVVDGRDDKEEIAELERLNARLADSLDRCRRILADCQSKLAANANDAPDEPGEHSASF
jgi:hypothetical protein